MRTASQGRRRLVVDGQSEAAQQANPAAYETAIISLAAARKAATEIKLLTKTAQRSSGTAAWVFHDAVRAAQRIRIQSGIARADQRLKELRSSEKRLKKENAAERKRQREREQARQERQAERKQAREAEANRQQQQPEHDDSDTGNSGGSNPPGYTGPRLLRARRPGLAHPC